jgi:hypothetical protein
VLETNASFYMDIVKCKTRTCCTYGNNVRGYDSRRFGLNHSAILLSKHWLWRQSYRIADVLSTNVTSCINFVKDKTRSRGAYGAYVRGYDSRRSGFCHSAILLFLKIGYDASHIESRTCLQPTRRLVLTLSNARLELVAHTANTSVATTHGALALTTRPSCSQSISFGASHIESRTCLEPTRRPI